MLFMSMEWDYVGELWLPLGLLFYLPHDTRVLESQSGMILTEKIWRTQRETYPSAALSIKNPTWADLSICSERPVTNHLSHGTAYSDN
jgi:hypothetical protein